MKITNVSRYVVLSAFAASPAFAFQENIPSAPPVDRSGTFQEMNERVYREGERAHNESRNGVTVQQISRADGKPIKLSKKERAAARDIDRSIASGSYDEAKNLAMSAYSDASSEDARYFFSARQMQLAEMLGDHGMLISSLESAIGTGLVPEEILPLLYRKLGDAASDGRDYTKAEQAYTQLVKLTPQDPTAYLLLGNTYIALHSPAEALKQIESAIQLQAGAGNPVPETWTSVRDKLRSQAGG